MSIIKTCASPEDLATTAAEHIVTVATEAIDDHEYFTIALAGGSTPRGTYETLATIEFAQRMDWERAHIFWSDERAVPPDHKESNYRMAYESMLKPLAIPEENIHRVLSELEPERAALHYQDTLAEFFSQEPARFDLILLGLGTDGHTASLFPGTDVIDEKKESVVAQYVEKLESWRITFTPKLINAALNVTFLVSGQRKAAVLGQVLSGRYQPENLPAQIVRPDNGILRWIVDAEAADLL